MSDRSAQTDSAQKTGRTHPAGVPRPSDASLPGPAPAGVPRPSMAAGSAPGRNV